MPTLARYTRPVDGTIPVPALLYDDEVLYASQEGVGLYDGPYKSPAHQAGTLHVTSHRLFFISASGTRATDDGSSLVLDLQHIVQTDSYSGFFKSSPKVTVKLSPFPFSRQSLSTSSASASTPALGRSTGKSTESPDSKSSTVPSSTLSLPDLDPFEAWECAICAYRNPPGLSPSARRICALCGVPRDSVPGTEPTSSAASIKSTTDPISVSNPISRNANTLSSTALSVHPSSLPASVAPTPAIPSSPPLGRSSLQEDGNVSNRRPRQPSSISCPACTFLNHPSLRECELCGTLLPSWLSSAKATSSIPDVTVSVSKSAPSSRPMSPELSNDHTAIEDGDVAGDKYIRLSFRKGGDKAFYAVLKRSLLSKAWEGRSIGKRDQSGGKASYSSTGVGRSGIRGVLQNVQSTAFHTSHDMSNAFQDLEALMIKAKDMVRFAAELNDKLSAISQAQNQAHPSSQSQAQAGILGTNEPIEPEEVTFIRSSLSQLGLQMRNAPVTLDMMNDEQKWVQELARELAGVLQGDTNMGGKAHVGIMRERGIIGLDEVWGGWNRARGVALVPPSTLLQTLPYLPIFTSPPITSRKLNSGLTVLHTPAYTINAFTDRILAHIVEHGPCTTVAIAQDESLSIGLVQEMIVEVEMNGEICRDEAGAGSASREGATMAMAMEVKWWVNVFAAYEWDGQVN